MPKSAYSEEQERSQFPYWRNKSILMRRLHMELTERCNNNCIHCYINRPADDTMAMARELSTEQVKDILEEAASLGCLTVRFTGGEPTLREDFEELYLYARRLGLRVNLFTNGTLITPHLVKLFTRIPPLGYIEITVYGMKKKSYEAVTRAPGSFEAVWAGMDLLLENEVRFIVKGTILPPNKSEVEEFEAWASTIPWMKRMKKRPSFVRLLQLRGRQDSENKNRLINGIRTSPEEELQFFLKRKEEYLKDMKRFCSKCIRPPGDSLFTCGAGISQGYVDPYGYFQICGTLQHPDTTYDLKDGSLKDAMINFVPKVRQAKAENPDYLARCAGCFLTGLCEQCPARAWSEHGTLDTPVEYLCELAHTQARYLGLLAEDELAWEVEDWKERIERFTAEEAHLKKSECEAE